MAREYIAASAVTNHGEASMVPTALLEHQLPGRIRLRIPAKRGDGAFFETVRRDMAGTAAVQEVIANPHTGSLLIRYTGDIGKLATETAERGLFTVQRAKAASRQPKAAATASPINTAAVGLSGLGLYQVARGRSLGSASEIFWNAYGAYRILGNPALALLLCGLGLWQTLRGDWLGPASALLFYALVARKLAADSPAPR
jgi:hypothetical protein